MYDFIFGAVVDFIFFERLSVLDTGQPILYWSPLWHCLRSSWTWFSFCSQAFETFHSFPPPTTSPASIPRTLNSISFIRDTGELWESHLRSLCWLALMPSLHPPAHCSMVGRNPLPGSVPSCLLVGCSSQFSLGLIFYFSVPTYLMLLFFVF